MRTARKECESNCYHVMVRGVGQQIIYESAADRSRYLGLLREAFDEEGAELLAWCLMDNHAHILAASRMDALSRAMRRVGSGYALYFNLVHGRCGHLFQGRFKCEAVDSEAYLAAVVRYIHQNPMKAGIAAGCDYEWSSYGEYLAGRLAPQSVDVMGIFGGREQFVSFHALAGQEEGVLDVTAPRALMDDGRALAVARELVGDDLENVKGMGRARRDAVLASLKEAGLGVRQIQRLTGVSLGTISKA